VTAKHHKIGIVLDASLDPHDGVQQYVLRIGEWLAREGHEVHYLVGETNQRQLPNIHGMSKNVQVKFNGNRVSIPLWARRRHVKKLLRQLDLDILHVQMPHHPLMAQIIVLSAQKSTAVVGTFHILPVTATVTASTKLLGLLLRPSLRRFDKIVAVSEPAQAFVNKSFGVESAVLSNVIDLAWYQSAAQTARERTDKIKIVFLGRLVERKGVMQLLEAVAALPITVQQKIEVVIGGKGPLLPKLKAYTSQAKLQGTVSYAGFIDESDKPMFLRQADIAVFPAVGGESFGIVLLEAMAAGSGVVIGGNNPGYASVLAPFPETLFDPNDTSAFSKKLESFIGNGAKRRKLHVEQQRHITAFDVNVVGPKLINYYENAIAKRLRYKDNKHI
jgi:phosphatidylinositol alpha-mannosyltransferase